MESFIIDITPSLSNLFQRIETERRIILSARFGEGKSYLLHQFKEKYKDSFAFFTLYPASYSVSPNEHILEYTKRDIIFQLKQNYDENLNRLSFRDALEQTAVSVKMSFANYQIINLASFLGVNPVKWKQIRKSSKNYIQSFNVPGSIYERDLYTEFITKAFNNIREKQQKKIVLIIEDLDRLDPSQMFNILTVFGSQIDRKYLLEEHDPKLDNKFGADVLISVMDIDRAEKSYQHIYGEQSNFSGFIAKYLDFAPYRYSINSLARDKVANNLICLYNFPKDQYNEEKLMVRETLMSFLEQYSVRELETLYYYISSKTHINITGNDAIPLYENYSISSTSPYSIIEAIHKTLGIDLIDLLLKDNSDANAPIRDMIFMQYYAISKLSEECRKNGDVVFYMIGGKTYRITYNLSDKILQTIKIERIVALASGEDLSCYNNEEARLIISNTRRIIGGH